MKHLIRSRYYIFIIILSIFSASLSKKIVAQNTVPEVVVTGASASEDEGALSLEMYFTIQGPNGQADPNAEIVLAQVMLEDGTTYPAEIVKAPYNVYILIDASGSMEGIIDDVRQIAINMVEQAPPQVNFAVLRFDEDIDFLQPFTNDHEAVIAAINEVEVDNSGTCLFDVAYTAVGSLRQLAQGQQQAIVLFTDGRDERTSGLGNVCSQNTYDQLVTYASRRDRPIAIHTVGLAQNPSRINRLLLGNLSQTTGGLSAVGDEDQLNALFRQIGAVAESQWIAQVEMMPTDGQHAATLHIVTDEPQWLRPSSAFFISNRDYSPPPPPEPDPFTMSLESFRYDEARDQFFFTVRMNEPERVGRLHIEIYDRERNAEVLQYPFHDPQSVQRVDIRTNLLTERREYRVEVYPLDLNSERMVDENGVEIVKKYEFGYFPKRPFVFQIDMVSLNEDKSELTLDLTLEGDHNIASYRGFFLNSQTRLQVANFVPHVLSEEALRTQWELDSGGYVVVLQALDADGSLVGRSDYTFELEPEPSSFLSRVWQGVWANPLLSFLLLLLGLLIGWFLGRLVLERQQKKKGIVVADARQGVSEQVILAPQEVAPPQKRWAKTPAGLPIIILKIEDSLDANYIGQQFELTRFPFKIGRDGCDLTMAEDGHLSRHHLDIIAQGEDVFIVDKGSSNGTFIDEERIPANERVPLDIEEGVNVRLGESTHLRFHVKLLEPSVNGRAKRQQPVATP